MQAKSFLADAPNIKNGNKRQHNRMGEFKGSEE